MRANFFQLAMVTRKEVVRHIDLNVKVERKTESSF
jgi:hypothetical protein